MRIVCGHIETGTLLKCVQSFETRINKCIAVIVIQSHVNQVTGRRVAKMWIFKTWKWYFFIEASHSQMHRVSSLTTLEKFNFDNYSAIYHDLNKKLQQNLGIRICSKSGDIYWKKKKIVTFTIYSDLSSWENYRVDSQSSTKLKITPDEILRETLKWRSIVEVSFRWNFLPVHSMILAKTGNEYGRKKLYKTILLVLILVI